MKPTCLIKSFSACISSLPSTLITVTLQNEAAVPTEEVTNFQVPYQMQYTPLNVQCHEPRPLQTFLLLQNPLKPICKESGN